MRQRGMTLIEAMIAITILAIVTSMVWSGFSQTARNKRRLEERADRFHVVRMAMERMTRELSMAYVSAHVNPNPLLQTVKTGFYGVDSSGEDRLDFTSFSHQRLYRDAHESDQNELSYFVAPHPEDSSMDVLVRREQNRIDENPQKGGRIQIMVEDVKAFDLEYLDQLSGEWTKTWDSTQLAMQPNRLPVQVKITLEIPDPRDDSETLTFGTRASIPIRYALNHAIYNP